MIKKITYCIIVTYCLISLSCTETFIPVSDGYNNLLVVEGNLTDELKQHKIKLTESYTLTEEKPFIVSNASVTIEENNNNFYEFEFNDQDSSYVSVQAFQAEPNSEYILNIELANGEIYRSTPQSSPNSASLSISPSVQTQDNIKGIRIGASSLLQNNTDTSYYRYEYEETYKIIAPQWSSMQAVEVSPNVIDWIPREEEERVCYNTELSSEIIINSSNQEIIDFPVLFLSQQNPKIGVRYSILVKQYLENEETYQFYKNLKKISEGSENTLSPIQPGKITGNIRSNTGQNALGYFSVSSKAEQRIFFNYEHLFPNEPHPPYFRICDTTTTRRLNKIDFSPNPPPAEALIIIDFIHSRRMVLWQIFAEIYYIMVPRACGDCTALGSNEIPEFWEEE